MLPFLGFLLLCGPPPEKTPTETLQERVTHIPAEAILVSEDDGSKPCRTTPEQISAWIADANTIYKPLKIVFDFKGDDSDCLTVKNSWLNNLILSNGKQAEGYTEAMRDGNALAAQFPDKMTLIFRYGASSIAATDGTASIETDFALLPQFESATLCEHQNRNYAAQIIGLYFGLHWTAARAFINESEAEKYLHEHKDDITCFDGDGIKDTPPDPFITSLENICQPTGTVTVAGQEFALPVNNLMAHYDTTKSFSPTQTKWVKWAVQTRLKNKMGTPTNLGSKTAVKADKLTVAEKKDCETSEQTLTAWNAARWNGNSQLLCKAGKAGSLTFLLTFEEDGNYRIDLYATQAPDFGIVRVLLDDMPFAKPFDFWAPCLMPTGRLELGTMPLTKGTHTLRFEVTGKNDLATDTHFGLDALDIQPFREESAGTPAGRNP